MNKVILFLIFLLVLGVAGFAQTNSTESLTITTYYPAPYGVYRYLKLSPTNTVPSAPALTAGVMYYDNSADMIKYYNNCGGWVNLSEGGGAGYWAENATPTPHNIYYANAMGSVGIGTDNPQQKLDVNGTMRLAPVAAPPVTAEGSMYYNMTLQTPCYRDGTQWNNFISESGVVLVPAGQSITNPIIFRKTYAVPPVVIATVVSPAPSDPVELSLFVDIYNLTNSSVRFDLDVHHYVDPTHSATKETAAGPEEIHYIVLPR